MACACKGRKKQQYVWTSADGTQTMVYNTELEAKAKVIRKGGSYKPVG
jgi:acetyl-CoA carboxylase beta subunit